MSEETKKDNVLDVLLGMPQRKARTAQVKMLRMSEDAGVDVIFTIRELSYSKVAEINKLSAEADDTAEVIAAGVAEPNLRDDALLAHYHVKTPHDLVRKLMSAGDAEELRVRIEQLSGYRQRTTALIEDVKKN